MFDFNKLFGDPNKKIIKDLMLVVEKINGLEPDLKEVSDSALLQKTNELKNRINSSDDGDDSLDDILPEAFALVREAARRTLNQRHYDVQILGGLVLNKGKIAEMKTGEGKTLVATLPAYLNALSGGGVHIVTVNDYLSKRDAVWMGQIYNALGLSVACINHNSSYIYDPLQKADDKMRDDIGAYKVIDEFLRPCSRKEAYAADIVYGTNNEFGFDYLRDNLAYENDQISQREHSFAIIDEVDSILIDEARTPLIISAPDEESGDLYNTFSRITPRLQAGADYNIDEKMKAVTLTEEGIDRAEKMLGIKDIYTEKGVRYVHHLEQALRAQALFQRDKDYVVRDGQIIIVDEFTGRLMPGRRWSDGLHQAVEAKENVSIQRESRTMASITFQNYFRMYKKLSGMTGTALTSAEEFHKVYNLDVIQIPTNKLIQRQDLPDKILQTESGKLKAVVEKIKDCNKNGQPVLVGTISIDKNERLSQMLKREGIEHSILNAKNHEQEGSIIAQAGKLGAVTIATNMAGRGVDIILGGNPADSEDAKKVLESGGLFVLGTERHEARRIDNQLRGRAGRQGDPGATQFFVSLEDDLMRVFGSDKIKDMMGRFGIPEDEPIENKMVSRALEGAQSKIEGFNFDARKHILEYDDVMNRQRKSIYRRRRIILLGSDEDIEKEANEMVVSDLHALIDFHTAGDVNMWSVEDIFKNLQARFGVAPAIGQEILKLKTENKPEEEAKQDIKDYIDGLWKSLFEKRKQELGEDFYVIVRTLMLQVMDMLWVGHLEVMEHTRSSVRLRAYGQHDPLVEYKNEGLRLFRELEAAIKTHITHLILKTDKKPIRKMEKTEEVHPSKSVLGDVADTKQLNAISSAKDNKKVGRNDPCSCGSGKKYKRCHGA